MELGRLILAVPSLGGACLPVFVLPRGERSRPGFALATIVTTAAVRADGGVPAERPGAIRALVMRVRFPRQEV